MDRGSFSFWDDFEQAAQRAAGGFGDLRVFVRLRCVRDALRQAEGLTRRALLRTFQNLEFDKILDSLIEVATQCVLILGASIGIGGAIGAGVGSLAGGVGAVPGAVAGGLLGAKVGGWILAVLGLKAIAEFFIDGLPKILGHYQDGLSLAWRAGDYEETRRRLEVTNAAWRISIGHEAIVVLLLTAVVAYLTRGRGNMAKLVADAKGSKLGGKLAQWMAKHEDALRNHPRLQPQKNRVAGESGPAQQAQRPAQHRDADAKEKPEGKAAAGHSFQSLMKKVETLDVSTPKDASVFYSGGPANRALAEQFAKANGKRTLEMTPGGKWLDDLQLFGESSPLAKKEAFTAWSRLSERYAAQASGEVYAFVNGTKPTSVFSSIELPTLMKNPHVTGVNRLP